MDAKDSQGQADLEASEHVPDGNDLAALEDFRIMQPKEIGNVLRQLMSRRDFLTVQGSNRPHRIVTRILEVDQNAGHFIFDCSADQIYNRSLLESEQNFFSATQGGVRIQFVSGRAEQHAFEGSFAFRSQIPESLYRMQRREYFRVETPLMQPYRCTTNLPGTGQVGFDIYDLSFTGVGLRSKDPALGELPLGTEFCKTVLNCHKMGLIETALTITNLRNIKGLNGPIYHFGCRFERFPRSKESDLQRIINYLELARRG